MNMPVKSINGYFTDAVLLLHCMQVLEVKKRQCHGVPYSPKALSTEVLQQGTACRPPLATKP